MGRIPAEAIEAIRERADIAELVGRHLTLRPAGRNLKGLCPFHEEKTPSFQVNPARGIFHCFGCGAGGDAIRFAMRLEGLSFPEAARALARDCGIEIAEASGGRADSGVAELRTANARALAHYREALTQAAGAAARRYLAGRGLAGEAFERFEIGYAPDSWDALLRALRAAGIPPEVGERAGLLAPRRSGTGYYDRLRDRVTFPIRDEADRIVGFGARALQPDQEPKYLNTPETAIFRKREALYGAPEAYRAARRAGRLVLVEGYFDRIAAAAAGVPETAATCGTALSTDHARRLRRHCRDVVLLFDGDAAGRRAVGRALEILLPAGLRVRSALLAPGEDPASLLEREGSEALRRCIDAAEPALERAIRDAAARGQASPWEKADAIHDVVRLLALLPDPVECGEMSRRLAFAVDAQQRDIESALAKARAGRKSGESDAPVEKTARPDHPEARIGRGLAQLLLAYPRFAAAVDTGELRSLLSDPLWKQLLPGLAETARRATSPDDLDLDTLSDSLDEAARVELYALGVGGHPPPPEETAAQTISDTLRRLRLRRDDTSRRQTTNRLRGEARADSLQIMAEKQRQLEQRRLAQGLTPDPARN